MKYRLYKPGYVCKTTGERKEQAVYHIAFRDHLNRRQDLAGSTREQESHSIAGKVADLVRCRTSGEALPSSVSRWLTILPDRLRERLAKMDLIDPSTASAEKPLAHHLEGVTDGNKTDPGFRQALEARGNTDAHVNLTVKRVKSILDNCGFTYWRDLVKPGAATDVEVYLGKRRTKGEITGTSYNYYVRDFKSFCRWMVKSGRAPAVAMEQLARVKNADADATVRRALSVEEMRRLTETAAAGKPSHGLTGEERAMLYRFCFETGMRPGQVRSLKVSDFSLQADPPTVTTQARYVKRRRIHVQTLRPALAVELAKLYKTKLPTAPALKMPSKYHMADMLRHDLADARTAWIDATGTDDKEREERQRSDFLHAENHQGEVAVFYSVRHGHGTALAEAGVPEKDIAASMHHASRTTTTRYLHADRKAVSRAIGAMPDLSYPVRAVATGTDGAEPMESARDLRRTFAAAYIPMESSGERDPIAENEVSEAEDVICAKNAVESGADRAWRKGRRYGLKIRWE